ncbi:hypothetical protein E4T56_gene18277 [Termitomyces sp. T112]|nr:hypothetical protein E4T56_gene18277 [Termitomyces sp. T112]
MPPLQNMTCKRKEKKTHKHIIFLGSHTKIPTAPLHPPSTPSAPPISVSISLSSHFSSSAHAPYPSLPPPPAPAPLFILTQNPYIFGEANWSTSEIASAGNLPSSHAEFVTASETGQQLYLSPAALHLPRVPTNTPSTHSNHCPPTAPTPAGSNTSLANPDGPLWQTPTHSLQAPTLPLLLLSPQNPPPPNTVPDPSMIH